MSMTAVPVAPLEARRVVEEFCDELGIGLALKEDVLLCVSEAVTNVVMHAYRNQDGPGSVSVEASLDDHLCIRVIDAGMGVAPRHDSPGLGVGLPIMSQVADSLEALPCEGGGTELVMKFALPLP